MNPVGWILSPVGRVVGGFVAALALCAFIYSAGWRAHAAISREALYKAERDAARRDLEIERKAAKSAHDMAEKLDELTNEARRRADEYAKSLPKSGGCILNDADVKQLRHIRDRKSRSSRLAG